MFHLISKGYRRCFTHRKKRCLIASFFIAQRSLSITFFHVFSSPHCVCMRLLFVYFFPSQFLSVSPIIFQQDVAMCSVVQILPQIRLLDFNFLMFRQLQILWQIKRVFKYTKTRRDVQINHLRYLTAHSR